MLPLPHLQDLQMPPNIAMPLSNDSGFHELGEYCITVDKLG